jgi:hypothetical protein
MESAFMTIVIPIHVATIRGKQLRLYRTPASDGRPDFAWHSTDDLQNILGTTREVRRYWAKECRKGPFKADFRTVATPDGLTTIAPHYVAQGTTDSFAQMVGSTKDVEEEYGFAVVEACNVLTDASVCNFHLTPTWRG